MLFSSSALALGLISLTSAAPFLQKRALSANDTNTLQLALFLEHLEFNLYSGGFNSFTDAQYTAEGFPAGFRENVGVIAQHEATHAATITKLLQNAGVAPVPQCKIALPRALGSAGPMFKLSPTHVLISVGIGAYLGGALNLVDNPDLLTDASSILTVEARHDAYLRTGVGASPFPNAFDTALTAVFAYNLASMFLVSCPEYLPIILLPKLNLTSPTPPPNLQPPLAAGTPLNFAWDPTKFFVPVDPNAPLYIAMINQNVSAPIFQQVTKTGTGTGTVPVPSGVAGVAFAVLTTFSGGLTEAQLTSFGTLAGPAEVVAS
ncbi:hypothetical protein MMC25_003832 [Agyrium rufum]|nr:hypothetical protein [Agyrium rufum]